MKTIYLLYILIAFLSWSCTEDKGNYDYSPINDVQITDISNQTSVAGDSLIIPVTFTRSLNSEEKDLDYLWEIDGKKVATTRNLNITTPTDITFGNKICRYLITDKSNGMQYFKTFTVNIVSPFNWGYYLLTEKEDHSTILSYFSVLNNNTKFIHTHSISGTVLGNLPRTITGSFGYISSLKDYFWTINILTTEGETPVIITENATFIPNQTISSNSFVDQSAGNVFAPEFVITDRRSSTYFISQGKFISYTKGLLYRPAKHNKDYYWSYPIWSPSGVAHMFVFDQTTQKYYVIKSQPNVPEEGIIGDPYAYDRVVEIKQFPDLTGHTIIGNSSVYVKPQDEATVVTANTEGINMIKIAYNFNSEAGKFVEKITLPVSGADSDTKAVLITQDWYFSIGNKIYTSPTLLPKLTPFIDIPTEYGKIVNINCSAMKTQLVVTTYDSNSTNELKGSVLFIDIQTKKMTIYKNVIHKCVSILSCNSDPWGWESGDNK
ncbi:MAG: PKD-like family lipoprotein [Odoribacter sp.]